MVDQQTKAPGTDPEVGTGDLGRAPGPARTARREGQVVQPKPVEQSPFRQHPTDSTPRSRELRPAAPQAPERSRHGLLVAAAMSAGLWALIILAAIRFL